MSKDEKVGRRDFLKTAAAGGIGVVIGAAGASAYYSQAMSALQNVTTSTTGAVTTSAVTQPQNVGPINFEVWQAYSKMLDRFSAATGVPVNYTFFADNSQLVTKWKNGGYQDEDMAVPENYWVQQAAQAGVLNPIRLENITHYNELYDFLRNITMFQYQGQIYGVPMRFGAYSIIYNKDRVPESDVNYDIFWNPKYKGRITTHSYWERTMVMAAARLYPDEFKKDIIDLTDDQIAKVKDSLVAMKPNVKSYYSDADPFIKLFVGDEVDVGYGSDNWARRLYSEFGKTNIGFAVPPPSSIAWVEAAMISKATKWRDACEKLADYLIEPHIAAEFVAENNCLPTNSKAEQYMTDATKALVGPLNAERFSGITPYKPINNPDKWIAAWQAVQTA